MIMELLSVLNVMENVLPVMVLQTTVLSAHQEEILNQNVSVMMELLMIMVFVLLVHTNVIHVIVCMIVLHALKPEKKNQPVNVLMVLMM